MATRSLSPNRIAQKLREHRHAVMVLALMRAKKIVLAQIRAKGQRISDYSNKEISQLAHAELERNRTSLIAEAEYTIATWLGFAYLRVPGANVTTDAQKQSEPISTTSTLQISGAK